MVNKISYFDSRVVEAFLNLCHGKCAESRRSLRSRETAQLLQLLHHGRGTELYHRLLDSPVRIPRAKIFDLLHVANTRADATLAAKCFRRLDPINLPGRQDWARDIASKLIDCPREWLAILLEILLESKATSHDPPLLSSDLRSGNPIGRDQTWLSLVDEFEKRLTHKAAGVHQATADVRKTTASFPRRHLSFER